MPRVNLPLQTRIDNYINKKRKDNPTKARFFLSLLLMIQDDSICPSKVFDELNKLKKDERNIIFEQGVIYDTESIVIMDELIKAIYVSDKKIDWEKYLNDAKHIYYKDILKNLEQKWYLDTANDASQKNLEAEICHQLNLEMKTGSQGLRNYFYFSLKFKNKNKPVQRLLDELNYIRKHCSNYFISLTNEIVILDKDSHDVRKMLSEFSTQSVIDPETISVLNELGVDSNSKVEASSEATAEQDLSARLEAEYQKLLVEKAMRVAQSEPNLCRYGTQGRILVEVALSAKDIPTDSILFNKLEEAKKSLKISERPTYCSIDVSNHPPLKKQYIAYISQFANNVKLRELTLEETLISLPQPRDLKETFNEALEALFKSSNRASIIPLQEEMEMHVLLLLRVLEDKMAGMEIYPNNWEMIKEKMLKEVNDIVMDVYSSALVNSYQETDDSIDIMNLNKELDNARKEVSEKCRQALFKTANSVDKKFLDKFDSVKSGIHKHFLTAKTATGTDYLRTDDRNATVIRISATDNTAHHKLLNAHTQALRFLKRNHYNYDGKKVVVGRPARFRVEVRVPSIAILQKDAEKQSSHPDIVKDVVDKLADNYEQMQKQLGPHYKGPLIYNLLTSLNDQITDRFYDKQTQNLTTILKGAHQFNRQQVLKDSNASLWLIQNIPVNQHTWELSYDSKVQTVPEATLMMEIALLSNLKQNLASFSRNIQSSITAAEKVVREEYIKFLKDKTCQDKNFFETSYGQNATQVFKNFKNEISNKQKRSSFEKLEDNLDIFALADRALLNIMVANQHLKKQFGMLTQALSVFTERACQFGCKSANERFQAVSGRVDLLLSIQGRLHNPSSLSLYEKKLIEALKEMAQSNNSEKVSNKIFELQKFLDLAYNEHCLYGNSTAVSHEDQGASSKLQREFKVNRKSLDFVTSKDSFYGDINSPDTNIGESSYLKNLFQENAKAMQMHHPNQVKNLLASRDAVSASHVKEKRFTKYS